MFTPQSTGISPMQFDHQSLKQVKTNGANDILIPNPKHPAIDEENLTFAKGQDTPLQIPNHSTFKPVKISPQIQQYKGT